jgi:hypothetical protein
MPAVSGCMRTNSPLLRCFHSTTNDAQFVARMSASEIRAPA